MAKAKNDETAAAETNPPAINDLLAGLSDEERAELLALTGQNANLSGSKVPILKVNYCDVADVDGNTIKKGNFVYNQSSKTAEVEVVDESDGEVTKEERMLDLGTDLGKSIAVTVLGYRQQYSYYNADAKLRCNSQIFGQGEVPVGSNHKLECRSGKCPRRKDGLDKKEKCICQFVVPLLVEVAGEKQPALMYVKGSNYFPFNDYLKAAGPIPLFWAPTKMKTKVEKDGSVTYYVTSFELDTANPYPQLERDIYKGQVKGAIAQIEEHKKAQAQKQGNRQLVDRSEGPQDSLILDDEEIVF